MSATPVASPAGGPPARRRRGGAARALVAFGLVGAIVVVVNAIVALAPVRVDLTDGGRYTIGDATRRIVAGLDRTVTIKLYLSRDLPARLLAYARDLEDTMAELAALGSDRLRIEVIDPKGDKALEAELARKGVTPYSVTITENDERQQVPVFNSAVVHCEDRHAVAPLILFARDPEYDLAVAIHRARSPAPPKIAFLAGHGEPTEAEGRKTLTETLRRSYRVIDLETKAAPAIPDDVDALVVIGPREKLADHELFAIDQHVMRGGALVVLINSQVVDNFVAVPRRTGLEGLLAAWGLRTDDFLLGDPICDRVPVRVNAQSQVMVPYAYFVRTVASNLNAESPVTRGLGELRFLFATPIQLPGSWAKRAGPGEAARPDAAPATAPVYHELVSSSEGAWLVPPPFELQPSKVQQRPASPIAVGKRPLVAAVTGKLASGFAGKPLPPPPPPPPGTPPIEAPARHDASVAGARVVLVGDAFFVQDAIVSRGLVDNVKLVRNAVDWLVLEEDLIALRPPPVLRGLDPSKRTETRRAVAWGVNLVLVPLLVVACGLVRAGIARAGARREARAMEKARADASPAPGRAEGFDTQQGATARGARRRPSAGTDIHVVEDFLRAGDAAAPTSPTAPTAAPAPETTPDAAEPTRAAEPPP